MSRVITPEAILSYPNLFRPRAASEDADPKFSATFVFTEDTDISELKKAALAQIRERWGDKLAGAEIKVLETQHGPANFLVSEDIRLRLPWRDHPDDVAGKGYPEGSTFINARSDRKPGIVSVIPDADGKPSVIEDEARVYAGVIVRASLDPYTYDNSGNRGVTFGLGNVQVVRDGDRLDGRANAADEFDADPDAVADLSDLTDGEPVGATAGEGDDLSDLIG